MTGTGIWRAAGQRPGHFGVPVTGDHAAIQYRTVVLAAGGILRPDQVSITAPVNNLPRAPAAPLARREEELARLGQVLSAGENIVGMQVLHGLGGVGKSELALQVSCGTSAFPSARRTGRLLLPSGAGDCDQRSSRRATSLPERERTERRIGSQDRWPAVTSGAGSDRPVRRIG